MGPSHGQVPAACVSCPRQLDQNRLWLSCLPLTHKADGLANRRSLPPTHRACAAVGSPRTEIASHCGMSTWSRHSTTVRATADRVEGPYTHAATVVGSESHNAFYAYSPTDKVHLVYGIFQGTWPESCNPPPHCTDGTTPGESTALSPLPLIVSYKYEKSLCGTGGKGLHPPAAPLYPNSEHHTASLALSPPVQCSAGLRCSEALSRSQTLARNLQERTVWSAGRKTSKGPGPSQLLSRSILL